MRLKDYYYFLGLPQDASQDDIKKVYRKLSLKYHPDVNGDDPYFAERFREVNEAYETLVDPSARKVYNDYFSMRDISSKSTFPPKIQSFTASKIRATRGEEITIYWQTYDADVVKIMPFGLEKTAGERRFKITEFDGNGEFRILMNATNSHIQKTVAAGLVIREAGGAEKLPKLSPAEPVIPRAILPKESTEDKARRVFLVLAIVLMILAVAWFFNSL